EDLPHVPRQLRGALQQRLPAAVRRPGPRLGRAAEEDPAQVRRFDEGRRRALTRAIAIVPARLASTRLPQKMLLAETGSCLFEHTARAVAASGAFERVVVATDSADIVAAADAAGIESVTTSPDHKSGTDRVAEAWRKLSAAGERAG